MISPAAKTFRAGLPSALSMRAFASTPTKKRAPAVSLKLLVEARPAVHAMVEKGLLGGVSLGRLYPGVHALENGLVVAVTETATDGDIAALEAALKEVVQ